MSISAAFNSALSGLNTSSRLTDMISGNLANALTPGYAPRELDLQAQGTGGVAVTGVTRHVDPVLVGDRRLAESALANAQTRAGFAASVERVLGLPGEGGSIADRLTAFEAAIATASSRPEDETRLGAVLREATALGSALNVAASQVEGLRSQADAGIAEAVESLNTGLARVKEINTRIVVARSSGQETSALEDRRQQAIDAIAELVPLRQLERDRGAVALVSTGGMLLLDGRATQTGFEPKPLVAAHMTLQNGLVSGLEINRRGRAARRRAARRALRQPRRIRDRGAARARCTGPRPDRAGREPDAAAVARSLHRCRSAIRPRSRSGARRAACHQPRGRSRGWRRAVPPAHGTGCHGARYPGGGSLSHGAGQCAHGATGLGSGRSATGPLRSCRSALERGRSSATDSGNRRELRLRAGRGAARDGTARRCGQRRRVAGAALGGASLLGQCTHDPDTR